MGQISSLLLIYNTSVLFCFPRRISARSQHDLLPIRVYTVMPHHIWKHSGKIVWGFISISTWRFYDKNWQKFIALRDMDSVLSVSLCVYLSLPVVSGVWVQDPVACVYVCGYVHVHMHARAHVYISLTPCRRDHEWTAGVITWNRGPPWPGTPRMFTRLEANKLQWSSCHHWCWRQALAFRC